MDGKKGVFSPDQWRFLAGLEACGEPVPLDTAKALVPVKPRAREQLINRCYELGWIARTPDNRIGLTQDIPDAVRCNIKRLNTPEQVALVFERIRVKGHTQRLSKQALIKLSSDSGKVEEAADIELDLAHEFLKQRKHEQAHQLLSRAVGRLHTYIDGGGDDRDRVFVEAAIELSCLSFAVGRGMQRLLSYLWKAVELAETTGNVRSHALACLHL
ncbi:MAG: hypothetical protein JRK53_19865, partial [Deltaproteobacteria bacterium]|nr:hypothetical protein [Deltaproteobacteria bacterium]